MSDLKNMVESFRKLSLEVLEKGSDVNRIVISLNNDVYLKEASLEPINLTNWESICFSEGRSECFF